MPITYEIIPERRLVRVFLGSALTPAGIREHLESLRADPEFDPHYGRILDARDVREVPRADVIRAVAERLTAENAERSPRAVVAASPAVFGMFRMLEMLTEGRGHQVRVFRTMREAEAWFGLDCSTVSGS